jgi:hypothetical protein
MRSVKKAPAAPMCQLCFATPLDPARPVGVGWCEPCRERSRAFGREVIAYVTPMVRAVGPLRAVPRAARHVEAAERRLRTLVERGSAHHILDEASDVLESCAAAERVAARELGSVL